MHCLREGQSGGGPAAQQCRFSRDESQGREDGTEGPTIHGSAKGGAALLFGNTQSGGAAGGVPHNTLTLLCVGLGVDGMTGVVQHPRPPITEGVGVGVCHESGQHHTLSGTMRAGHIRHKVGFHVTLVHWLREAPLIKDLLHHTRRVTLGVGKQALCEGHVAQVGPVAAQPVGMAAQLAGINGDGDTQAGIHKGGGDLPDVWAAVVVLKGHILQDVTWKAVGLQLLQGPHEPQDIKECAGVHAFEAQAVPCWGEVLALPTSNDDPL